MKDLIVISGILLLFGCRENKPVTDLTFAKRSIEHANSLLFHKVNKLAFENPGDKVLIQLHNMARLANQSYQTADSGLALLEVQQPGNIEAMNTAMAIINKWKAGHNSYKPGYLPEETSLASISEARLYLLSCLNAYMQLIYTDADAGCMVIDRYVLKTQAKDTFVKAGEKFSCLNTFELNKDIYENRIPVQLDKILMNDTEQPLNNISTYFGNRYFEYTPAKPGRYVLVFSKKYEKSSGKAETYTSEVSFTVHP